MPRTAIRLSPDPSAPAMLADEFAAHLVDRLGLRACRFEAFPFDRRLPQLEPERIVLPAQAPGVQPFTAWRSENGIELMVRFRRHVLGRFVLIPERPTCGVALAASARADALAFADQVGEALGRSWIAFDRRAVAERGVLP
jgi:hypothetical protein